MSKQPLIKQDGVIIEAMSNAMFRVKLENGHEILATISGKMRCTTSEFCQVIK